MEEVKSTGGLARSAISPHVTSSPHMSTSPLTKGHLIKVLSLYYSNASASSPPHSRDRVGHARTQLRLGPQPGSYLTRPCRKADHTSCTHPIPFAHHSRKSSQPAQADEKKQADLERHIETDTTAQTSTAHPPPRERIIPSRPHLCETGMARWNIVPPSTTALLDAPPVLSENTILPQSGEHAQYLVPSWLQSTREFEQSFAIAEWDLHKVFEL